MVVTLVTPNAQAGDRRTTLKTRTKSDRNKLKGIIERKQKEGAAVLVECMGDTFKVRRYDPGQDKVIAWAKNARKGPKVFSISAANAVIIVIAPVAGG